MHHWTGHHTPFRTPPKFSVDQVLKAATSSYNGPERQLSCYKELGQIGFVMMSVLGVSKLANSSAVLCDIRLGH